MSYLVKCVFNFINHLDTDSNFEDVMYFRVNSDNDLRNYFSKEYKKNKENKTIIDFYECLNFYDYFISIIDVYVENKKIKKEKVNKSLIKKVFEECKDNDCDDQVYEMSIEKDPVLPVIIDLTKNN